MNDNNWTNSERTKPVDNYYENTGNKTGWGQRNVTRRFMILALAITMVTQTALAAGLLMLSTWSGDAVKMEQTFVEDQRESVPDNSGSDQYSNPLGGQNGDQYTNPYGDQYGDQYINPFGDQYGDQYTNPFGDQYGDQYTNPFGDQYGDQYTNPYGDLYDDFNNNGGKSITTPSENGQSIGT